MTDSDYFDADRVAEGDRPAPREIEPDPDRQRLHEAAESLLAERMRAQGRAPDDYTAEEYVRAAHEAQGRLDAGDSQLLSRDALLERALTEMGAAPPGGETVTAELLHARAGEILAERGFTLAQAPEGERVDALKLAIEELGKPGEPRRDLEVERAARATALVRTAVEEGVVRATDAGELTVRATQEPEQVIEELHAKRVFLPDERPSAYRDPHFRAAARKLAPAGDRVDEESVRIHMAAERLLLYAGVPTRAGGEPQYSYKEYLRAVEIVREIGVDRVDELHDATTRKLSILGLNVPKVGVEYHPPTPSLYLSHAADQARILTVELAGRDA